MWRASRTKEKTSHRADLIERKASRIDTRRYIHDDTSTDELRSSELSDHRETPAWLRLRNPDGLEHRYLESGPDKDADSQDEIKEVETQQVEAHFLEHDQQAVLHTFTTVLRTQSSLTTYENSNRYCCW